MNLRSVLRTYQEEGIKGIKRKIMAKYLDQTAQKARSTIADIVQSNRSNQDKFAEIYRRKLWLLSGAPTGETESLSGHGSSLRSTATLRRALESFLAERQPKAFFDAPCGDFNWMKEVRMPGNCDYIGGDIVPSVIENLRRTSTRDKTGQLGSRRFSVFDITADSFPDADIWFCKDCLQHLSLGDIQKALHKFVDSSIGIALISNHYGIPENTDIATGDFRYVDLMLPPFNLPRPVHEIPDHPVDGEPRFIAAWTREQIAAAIAK